MLNIHYYIKLCAHYLTLLTAYKVDYLRHLRKCELYYFQWPSSNHPPSPVSLLLSY